MFNDILSLRRAKAVVDYFYEKGIPKHRLKFTGVGERYPISKVDDEINRRVEIQFQ